ncbi:VOC family protein [Cellulosimicrobium cellulans]|uniref:VOC family protein n=1 Tax=Cellulosimicrobium cellulans TaxID=1710 RepID=UPI00130E7B5D|nr:VOC family protein [Cellulosimicrobium cellulans]
MTRGAVHHVELWFADLRRAERSWGWLLGALGYARTREWTGGCAWSSGGAPGSTDVVLESGPDVVDAPHERRRPGVNHLAFHAGTRAEVDALVREAPAHGWTLLFADRHPHAGGPDHYAAYLEDGEGLEVELVAAPA